MNATDVIKRYIKRKNFIEDFTEIDQAKGFNHRFAGKGTNERDKANTELTKEDNMGLYEGMGKLVEKIEQSRTELKVEIEKQEAKELVEFQSLENLKSLSEFHHKGGELKKGMNVLVERNRRSKLKEGILKSWTIGEVKNDVTGYGKYGSNDSKIFVEVEGEEKSWPFSMVYIKEA